MTKDEIIKLIEDNGLTLHGDIEHFAALVAEHTYTKYLEPPEAKQSGTISITTPTPIAYLCENATGHKYFRWKKPSSVYKPIPLYTNQPQRKPLTDEEIMDIAMNKPFDCAIGFARAIEAAHGIKE